MKTYEGWLTSLPPEGIFVFGSNTQGIHGAGNAYAASKYFGAIYGQAKGLQGQSYAIITTELGSENVYPMPEIVAQIGELYLYAIAHPENKFYIGYSADGQFRSGYTLEDLSYMFAFFPIPKNIIFEQGFWNEVQHQKALNTEI